ncbi:TPA: hypothetical protein QDA96_006148 [Burkholderia vietnamiensis]|uniref:hypothetical protein n=1 Tax=Burkholderia cepacia complex TaxID=87882 RepID=UPI0012D9FDB2|nr:hypothetical protein [Burkholderia vietnamiensis]HDR9045377.1 hypothetical protein [Burkholderia vietnamiensis]HDR9198550.1 hypothetical protein [Burkholderia vietnamiensis]
MAATLLLPIWAAASGNGIDSLVAPARAKYILRAWHLAFPWRDRWHPAARGDRRMAVLSVLPSPPMVCFDRHIGGNLIEQIRLHVGPQKKDPS